MADGPPRSIRDFPTLKPPPEKFDEVSVIELATPQ
jgi:hypothetical protein